MQQSCTVFLAAPGRTIVLSNSAVSKRETPPCAPRSSTSFPTDTFRSQTRRAERHSRLMPYGNARSSMLSKGEDAAPQDAFRRAVQALRSCPSERLQASPTQYPPRRRCARLRRPQPRLPSTHRNSCQLRCQQLLF